MKRTLKSKSTSKMTVTEKTNVESAVVDFVKRNPGSHAGDVRRHFGCKVGVAGQALRRAETKGKVTRTDDGINWRWNAK